jgi:GntR family transcriptional regulator
MTASNNTIRRSPSVSSQIRDLLRGRILSGYYESEKQLPSEDSLATEFEASRATVRTALAELMAEGFLYRRQGVGTFIRPVSPLEGGLERLESILTIASRQDIQTYVHDLKVDEVPADGFIADLLDIDEGTPVTRVRRTITADGNPISYFDDYVLSEWMAPEAIGPDFSGSVLDILLKTHGARVQEAVADITAVKAGNQLSEVLGTSTYAPLILIKETLFDEAGQKIGYSRNYFLPESINFRVVRR